MDLRVPLIYITILFLDGFNDYHTLVSIIILNNHLLDLHSDNLFFDTVAQIILGNTRLGSHHSKAYAIMVIAINLCNYLNKLI